MINRPRQVLLTLQSYFTFLTLIECQTDYLVGDMSEEQKIWSFEELPRSNWIKSLMMVVRPLLT